jgi:acetyl-CoA C-acetyltransferase
VNDDPERIPVIIAVGQVNDRPANPLDGMDSLELMVAALRAADEDGGGGLVADLDSLGIVAQLSFHALGNLCEPLSAAIGATPAYTEQTAKPHGDSPILLLNEAANRIGRGEARLAAVVGGEALRTAAARAKAGRAGADTSYKALRDMVRRPEPGFAAKHGLVAPVDFYPLFEQVLRAQYGQSYADAQAESGAMWAGMSEVAAHNPAAWIQDAVTAEEVITPSADNRMIAHPYTKLMVANSSVNQGAAFIVASVAEARRRGVPDDRMIYVGNGAAAKVIGHTLKVEGFERTTHLDVVIGRTLERNGMTVDDIDAVELYSCFPCVPKMARRALGWPLERPISVVGGLTFGGGPVGNYMSHAVAAMVLRLRQGGGNGFLYANGGIATDHHAIVLSNAPIAAARFPRDFDDQAEVDALSGPQRELDPVYTGPAAVETFTVFYGRDGNPTGGVVAALTPAGARTLAHIDVADAALVAFFTDGAVEPVGKAGNIVATHDPEYRVWVRA